MALGSQELNYSDHWAKWSLLVDVLRTKLLPMTFYDFSIRHFKKNVKSHVFLKSEKNEKYVFSNTAAFYVRQSSTLSDTCSVCHLHIDGEVVCDNVGTVCIRLWPTSQCVNCFIVLAFLDTTNWRIYSALYEKCTAAEPQVGVYITVSYVTDVNKKLS